MKTGVRILLAAALAGCGLTARAADRTWDGEGGDGRWGSATNWSGNAVPGATDRAILTTNGFGAAVRRIILSEPTNTVNELRFLGESDDVILDGEGSNVLAISSGTITGAGWPAARIRSVIACNVILGNSGTWQTTDNWSSLLSIYGDVTDKGKGYSVTFGNSQNMNHALGGAWDIGGSLLIQNYGVRIGGVYTNASGTALYGGSVTNAIGVYLDGRLGSTDQSETVLTIENLYQADSDRIRGATALGAKRTGGAVVFNGNPADAVAERVSALDLQSGRLSLTVAGRTAGVGTDLIFDTVQRASGASMLVSTNTGGRLIVEGAVNTNGIWQPWCFFGTYYSKVGDASTLSSTFNADYLAPAATGNDPAKLYRFSASSLALGENTSMWGLKWDSASAQALDLGPYDLTIGSGSLIVGGNSNKRISASGGQLVFGGEDVIYYVDGSASFSNSAPVAWSKPEGSTLTCPSLIFARGNRTDGITLDGEDRIGSYSNLYCYAYYSSARRTLTLAGPSDRTFCGSVNGVFNIEKRGSGRLTFAGANQRRSGSTWIAEGTVVLAHANAPAPLVMTNAVCEIAEGTVLSGVTVTVQTNATLRGLGTTTTVALQAGSRVAPGTANQIGTLTCGTHTYLSTNLVLAVRLNAVTNDVLKVNGNLTLPPTGERLCLDVSDVESTPLAVKGKSYTVAMWSGTDPATDPAWTVTTATPGRLDVSGAAVVIDKTGNRIVLSGLKPVIRGTMVMVL